MQEAEALMTLLRVPPTTHQEVIFSLAGTPRPKTLTLKISFHVCQFTREAELKLRHFPAVCARTSIVRVCMSTSTSIPLTYVHRNVYCPPMVRRERLRKHAPR